ncbi:cation:proton antiporter regulatory subunit, partial [Phascolarctobacterium succinatutens]
FNTILGLHGLLACLGVLIVGYVISTSDWLMSEYLRIESRFLVNLNEKHMRKHREAAGNSDSQWFDEDLQLAYYMVEENSPVAGKSLKTLDFRQNYGCNVLQLSNPHRTVDMPGAEQIVTSNDTLLVIGTAAQLQIFDGAVKQRKLGVQQLQPPQSLRQFMLASHMQKPEQQFLSLAITIDKHSPLLGTSMKDAQLRNKWSCLVIGLERGAFTITNPHVSLTFEENDLLWILGKQKMMNTLIREEIL